MATTSDIPHDDSAYSGDAGESLASVEYYRNKAREYQVTLQAVDASYQALRELQEIALYGDDSDLVAEIGQRIDEYDSKKSVFRVTAEAINLGASAINAAGGRFPVLSVPTGLGILPAIPAAGLVAAIGAAAALIYWGGKWIEGNAELTKRALTLGSVPEAQRADLARILNEQDNAASIARSAGFSGDVANIVKWVAIGALAYFAYKAFSGGRGL